MQSYAPYSSIYIYIYIFLNKIDDESLKKASYELYGISHHGGSLSGGHYIA